MIEKNDEVLTMRLDSLKAEQQERLESLTNKCLAFEEELGELVLIIESVYKGRIMFAS